MLSIYHLSTCVSDGGVCDETIFVYLNRGGYVIAGVCRTVGKITQNVMKVLLSFSGNVYNLPRNFGDLLDPGGALIIKQSRKGKPEVEDFSVSC